MNMALQLQKNLVDEICKAAKLPQKAIIKRMLFSMLHHPVGRFSELIANTDFKIKENGFVQAANYAISQLTHSVEAIGHEKIPNEGPILIASNHPGTFDGLAIVSKMPRDDIKIVISGIPFFKNLPNANQHFIYSTQDSFTRMETIRKSISHLIDGGALLIFPSGRLDPDPAVFNNAEENIEFWSKSIELILSRVSNCRLILAITSNVITNDYLKHPVTMLFKKKHERRRIIEFFQVIKQMHSGDPNPISPRITFLTENRQYGIFLPDPPLSMYDIKQSVIALLRYHNKLFY